MMKAALLALGIVLGLFAAPADGARRHFVSITAPSSGQLAGTRLTVRGTVYPAGATVIVGYRKGGDEPGLGVTTAHAGRWHVRVRLPRVARVIIAVSASGGEDRVRVSR